MRRRVVWRLVFSVVKAVRRSGAEVEEAAAETGAEMRERVGVVMPSSSSCSPLLLLLLLLLRL